MAKKEVPAPVKKLNMQPKSWFMLFVLISFLFYGNSISNGYSLDDELVTSTDRKAHQNVEKGIAGIKSIFTSNYAIDGKQNYEYRPIVTLSYAIEKSIFGESTNRVHISHFINIALYAVCGILLFQLLQVLFQQQASLFSGLVVCLFLIHPLHSEVVNNLKNSPENSGYYEKLKVMAETYGDSNPKIKAMYEKISQSFTDLEKGKTNTPTTEGQKSEVTITHKYDAVPAYMDAFNKENVKNPTQVSEWVDKNVMEYTTPKVAKK
jgi:hypothetical protein